MPIRLRLALWYGGLSLAVIAVLTVVALAVHVRAQYRGVDELLVAEIAAYQQALRLHGASEPLPPFHGRVLARLYGADQGPLRASPTSGGSPPLTLIEALAAHGGPAYGPPLRWLPDAAAGSGSFATVREARTAERLRIYAVRLDQPVAGAAYAQVWTSLAPIDQSIGAFGQLVAGIAVVGLAAIVLGGVAVAGRAIAPIRTVTRAARAIAASRDFDQRVPGLHGADELSELTRTFNEMLASLEEAYRAQQRFVADAAHELRAPLTAVRGNIDLLERVDDLSPEERRETVRLVRDAVTRLSRLVNDLLTLARADARQPLQFVPVELDAVLLRTLSELRAVSGRHHLAIEQIEPLLVEGDPQRLQDLLVALLDNALQYTPPGGDVRVALVRDGNEARLTVSDAGQGISDADLPHVFERFYRADPARRRAPGGTGLGLAIAHWIVDQHRGAIAIRSTLGKGTTVEVRLPLALPADGGAVSA